MNCVAKHDKSLLFPLVVLSSTNEVGGGYFEPGKYEVEIDGVFHDAWKGIIHVSSSWPDSIGSTIFHEWRHHWQRFNWGPFPFWPWSPSDDYEQSIRDYFKVRHELDALLFEYKFARNDTNDYWMDLIF